MKIYLVGGAVRDIYLNRPVTERDWVVVGATPQQMLDLGYKQVGKDFPVFLHPHTKEEYALARTERKTATGYTGFSCYAAPDVSLDQDLLRRDLTINAMAQDSQGQLIDPYGGLHDLNARILRHVSPAFAEDPLRILRVARFAARYHHLGFKLAPDTRILMYRMVKNGEVNHLVAERIWQEWDRSLGEANPEIFIQILRDCGALRYLLPELDILFGIPNPPHWHPEIDTGVHSLMALRQAAIRSDSRKIRFAALVHDLGKGQSPPSQWPSHRGHDAAGAPIINALAKRLRIPKDYQQLAQLTSRYHIIIHQAYELNPSTIVKLLEALDAFRRPQRFADILQVCEADACGRKDRTAQAYSPRHYLSDILQKLQQISASAIEQRGFNGPQIKAELHRLRVELVTNQFF